MEEELQWCSLSSLKIANRKSGLKSRLLLDLIGCLSRAREERFIVTVHTTTTTTTSIWSHLIVVVVIVMSAHYVENVILPNTLSVIPPLPPPTHTHTHVFSILQWNDTIVKTVGGRSLTEDIFTSFFDMCNKRLVWCDSLWRSHVLCSQSESSIKGGTAAATRILRNSLLSLHLHHSLNRCWGVGCLVVP